MATAVAAWPSTINVTNFSDYSENWDTNFAEFAPDVGPPKRRRRMSLSSETLSPVMYLTSQEVETFRTFYRDTLKDGTLPFTFPKPRTGVIEQYTFSGQAPQVKFADYGLYQVSMTWRNVPNTRASWLPLLTVTNALIPSIAPDTFADFTTEGSTDPHYWYLGNRYASFATWLAAMGGTYSRAAGSATYFKSGLLQSSAAFNAPRFPTDASGVATGLRLCGTQTELCLWNRDLNHGAPWGVSNMTTAKNQTGIDGVANSATLITASAANATIAQTITAASASTLMGVWLKRITGTGVIQISVDNGTTRTAVVPTASWVFYPISAAQTLANPTPKIIVATSGDAVAVDFVSVRNAGAIWDAIATTTATVTQSADLCSFPHSTATFSTFASTINIIDGKTGGRVLSLDDGAELGIVINNTALQFLWFNEAITTGGPTFASWLTGHKVMAAGSGMLTNGMLGTDGATVPITSTFCPAPHTLFYIGTEVGGTRALGGDMRQFALWNSVVASSADLVRLTT